MRQKKLVIGLLVMLAVLTSGFTYAFWSAGVTGNADTAVGTISIGTGDAVTTTVTVADLTDGGLLVPTGFEDGSTKFDSIDLTFDVAWDADVLGGAGTTGTLTATIDSYDILDLAVGGTTTGLSLAQIDAMFTFSVTAPTSMSIDGNQNMVLTVTFANEPATAAVYAMVASGFLQVNLTFTLGSIVIPA